MLSRRDEKLCEKEKGRRRNHFFKSFFITKLLDEAGGYRYQNVKQDEAIKRKLEEERLASLAEERAKALRPLIANETEKVHCIFRDRGGPNEILATSDTDFVIRKSIQTLNQVIG